MNGKFQQLTSTVDMIYEFFWGANVLQFIQGIENSLYTNLLQL